MVKHDGRHTSLLTKVLCNLRGAWPDLELGSNVPHGLSHDGTLCKHRVVVLSLQNGSYGLGYRVKRKGGQQGPLHGVAQVLGRIRAVGVTVYPFWDSFKQGSNLKRDWYLDTQ